MGNQLLRRSAISFIRTVRKAPRGQRSHLPGSPRGVSTAVARAQDVSEESFSVDQRISTPLDTKRRQAIKNAKPFSSFLTDNFQRQHDYLRISLTEKCNLRCLYCMPEEGVPQSPPAELLTTPEIYLLSSLFVSQGVTKIRLTGGEPTVRKDILPLMHQIGSLRSQGLRELCLTTNGISLHRKLESMVEAGLTGVNLSLDTLDPWQFQIMTRRKGFDAVMKSMERILEMSKLGAGVKLKVNCVVMRGMNEREIIPFVEMGREKNIEIRFIEYMPFDGNKWTKGKMLGYLEMLDIIRAKYPNLRKVQDHKNDTSKTYEIPGFEGKFGFITSMTHNFCGTCNRLRITSDGNLKVCLFGNAEVSLRDILRQSNDGEPIDEVAFEAMKKRTEGLIGEGGMGISQNEQELLEVIGMAVKRKKEKHAGMGQLENMKNRPMILIDERPSRPFQTSRNKTSSQNWPLPSSWHKPPLHLLHQPSSPSSLRYLSTSSPRLSADRTAKPLTTAQPQTPKLTHLTSTGTAHMVSISSKPPTSRTAVAIATIHFSNPTAAPLIHENRAKKGDVLGVARIAGIMAVKQTPSLIPLCHPIAITHVSVDVELSSGSSAQSSAASAPEDKPPGTSIPEDGDTYEGARGGGGFQDHGCVNITATVSCEGKTGVEMEALTAAAAAALTVYDMCKAVDRGMRIEGLRVVRKEGGASGDWVDGEAVDGSAG